MSEGHGLVGTTIAGKYRIKKLVGTGGMGAVYEGLHLDLAKRVAIKIIDSAAVMSAELTTRFKREARAASAVESEGIVQVFDVGRDPEVGLYMIMEFLSGEDLEMRLRKQPGRRLDPIFVAQIGHQVARALVKAHGARVVHRDLKPANIFITERDDGALRVKVLDFGISKLLASEASIASKEGMLHLTQAGVALGTPQYMSPEQAQGLTTVDHRTDVWGLGVVLYESLAGVPAYPELRTYQETIMKILTERAPPLTKVAPWVPEELAKVVHDAIEHDVGKRIQDCAIFAQRIAQAVPEAVMGTTGPFNAIAMARSGSMPNIGAPPANGAANGAANGPAPRPSMPEASSSAPASRPITLGDDTQVVVRAGQPFDEENPSQTMMAAEAPSTRRDDPPKVIVRDPGPVSVPESDDAPMSTGDPTMFQSPAWVDATDDRPTTMKSGVAIGQPLPPGGGPRPLHGALAAALTAIAIVGVGVGVLALTRGGSGNGPASGSPGTMSAPATQAAPPPEATAAAPGGDLSGAPAAVAEPAAPAPPATGTDHTPMAPATGAAFLAEPAPPLEPHVAAAMHDGAAVTAAGPDAGREHHASVQ